jgi:hypothetical protein
MYFQYCQKEDCQWRARCWQIATNPKGTVMHPWVWDRDNDPSKSLYYRRDWVEPFPKTPLMVTAREVVPVFEIPNRFTEPIGILNENESITLTGYYLRGSDVYGQWEGGGIIPLMISPFNNAMGVHLPHLPTTWKMKNLPPSLEEPVQY